MPASTAQQINIHDGTRAVAIYTNGATNPKALKVDARLYVNCPDDETLGDATMVCRTFRTFVGARAWALKTLAG